jgi:hypothetical protein
VPPTAASHRPSAPRPALQRVSRGQWPDLEEVLGRRSPASTRAAESEGVAVAQLTFADLAALERACDGTASGLDELLFWWLAERMLERLLADGHR